MVETDTILLEVLKNYQNARKWEAAKFAHIKTVSNTHVGSVGQDFVEGLCLALGLNAAFPENARGARSKNSPWDICINGFEFEVKTATEDVNGSFQFNHIRYHRPYKGVLCIGISPNEILFDAWTKADISTEKAGRLVTMDKGSSATFKLTKRKGALRPISEFSDHILKIIQS